MTKEELIAFEGDIASEFRKGRIRGPVHLSDGNEDQLIEVFKLIRQDDWVFSTWRSHYHALLHGIDSAWLRDWIMAGKSITIMCPERRFFSSAIVGGTCPIATGVAMAIKRRTNDRYDAGMTPKLVTEKVWCFVGDMTAEGGAFRESVKYAQNFDLPITFVIEDNGISTTTPTAKAWGNRNGWFLGKEPCRVEEKVIGYRYEKTRWPHQGTGEWIQF